MSDYSSCLFASPSFWDGTARLVDFGQTLVEYNQAPTDEEADMLAIRNDWFAVGEDLRDAAEKVLTDLD